MADVVTILPTSVEEIGFPLTVDGVPRATVEGWTVEAALLPWSTTDAPPIPTGATTWVAASWDTSATTLTAVLVVGPGQTVALTAGVTYRAYTRIVGAGKSIVTDMGTVACSLGSTYSGDPASSTRDAVRFELGDVAEPFHLSNAEIDYAISSSSSALAAAAELASALSARFAYEATSESIGDVRVARARSQAFADLAIRLTARAARQAPTGRVSLLARPSGEQPTRRFALGLHNLPEVQITDPRLTRSDTDENTAV